MSVETSKETLCINQIIGQKIDTIMVEEDFVVPDIKPDILNAISTSGTVCIYKKEVMDGKVKIDGCINAYIIYLADDERGGIRSLSVNSNFSKTIDFDKLKIGMMLESNFVLKTIECRVLNGRKISLKSIIDVNLKICSNEDLEFVKEIQGVKNIQLLNENLSVNSLLGTGISKVYAKDTIVIDNVDDLAEIMKVNVTIKNSETKISYNKVLIKSDAEVKIMYLTEDGRINIVTNLIPVMGFIDMPNVSDENLCDVKYEIKNLLIKPNNIEEHSVYVEIEIEACCNVYEKKEINLIQDLYSPSINIAYKQKMIRAMSDKSITKDVCSIREKQYIQEIGNNKIYDVDVCPVIVNKTILKDRVLYEGEVELKFLFSDSGSSMVNTQNIIIPFNYNMECPGVSQTSNIDTNIEIAMQDFVVMPDTSIDINIDMQFITSVSNDKNINVIQEINIEENRQEDDYSVIIYFVKPGDTLWNIAKRFRSTVKDITQINEIEDENKIFVGDQLFIPLINY